MAAKALIDDLNEQQREIVFAPLEDSLVVAGAGTGKTRVLIARLAYLLEVEGFQPYQIMAMTFTNKAAGEMNERLAAAMGWADNQNMWVGTFHGLCFRLLRQYALEAMLPRNFTLLTPSDQEALLRTFYANHGIKANDALLGSLKDHGLDPKSAVNRIMRLKDRGVRPQISAEQAQHYVQNLSSEWPNLVKRSDDELFEIVFACYERLRLNSGAVDFADLIVYAVYLLKTNEQVRTSLQRRFRYICVDEFQDTNEMQLQFLLLLKSADNHVFVVGDDDQAIYGWRGAQATNLNRIAQELPDMHVYELTINYRSTQNILTFANAIISGCTNRLTNKFLLNPFSFELWRQEDLLLLSLVARSRHGHYLETLLSGRELEALSSYECTQLINTLVRAKLLAPEIMGWRRERRWFILPGMEPLYHSGSECTVTCGCLGAEEEVIPPLAFPLPQQSDPSAVGRRYRAWLEEGLEEGTQSYRLVREGLILNPPEPVDLDAAARPGTPVTISRHKLNELTRQMESLHTSCQAKASHANWRPVPHLKVYLMPVQGTDAFGWGSISEGDDGAMVLTLVKRLMHSGYRHEDIAVLYRNNSLSLQVERALASNNIPYQVYGGIKFYERAEILSAMAYCRVLLNPKDDISFTRAINEPKRGMGKVALNKLADFARQCGLSLYEAIGHIVTTQDRQGLKLIKKCQAFYEQMEGFKRLLPALPLGDFLNTMLERSGLYDYYEEIDRKDKAARKGTSRVDNLKQLVVNAREYDLLQAAVQQGDSQTVEEVIARQSARRHAEGNAAEQERRSSSNLAQLRSAPSQSDEAVVDAPSRETIFVNFVASSTLAASTERTADGRVQDRGVQLMTIHASKGLEFPAVILVGAEEGLLPSARSDDENEERRLLYVALTRAQHCLFVTYKLMRMTYQGPERTAPSPFLVEATEHFEQVLDSSCDELPYEEVPLYELRECSGCTRVDIDQIL